MKKMLCAGVLALGMMVNGVAGATTIAEDVFTSKATAVSLKVKKFSKIDIMGNKIQGLTTRCAPTRMCGLSGASIYCNNDLDTSELFVAVGVGFMTGPKDGGSDISVPKTLVINDGGVRKDIPISTYAYDSGRSVMFGNWSEYTLSVPLTVLKECGVKDIQGLSVIMANPSTNTDGGVQNILNQQYTKKTLKSISDIYKFYLTL